MVFNNAIFENELHKDVQQNSFGTQKWSLQILRNIYVNTMNDHCVNRFYSKKNANNLSAKT